MEAELTILAKSLLAGGGGMLLFAWAIVHLQKNGAFQQAGDFLLKLRSQYADLAGIKARLQIEAELAIAAARTELTRDLKAEVRSLRGEVAALHEEVARWMRAERIARDEVHELRNKMNTLILQNQVMAEQKTTLAITGDRATKLLEALEKHQPEWFGQERRDGDRRGKTEPPKE